MPIIPGSNAPTVQRSTPNQGLPSFGSTLVGRGLAQLGQGIEQGFNSALKAADGFALLKDESEADKAAYQFLTRRAELLTGAGDPAAGIEPGLLNRQGEAAQGVSVQYQEQIDKIAAELSKGLSRRAQQSFRATIYPDIIAGFQNVSRHESAAIREARATLDSQMANTYANNITKNFLSGPEEVQADLDRMRARITTSREGIGGENIPSDPEARARFYEGIDIETRIAQEQAITGRIANALAAKDVEQAELTLEQFGGLISDTAKATAQASIGSAYAGTAARNAAKMIVGAATPESSTRALKDQGVALVKSLLATKGVEMTPEYVDLAETLIEAELKDLRADAKVTRERAGDIPLTNFQSVIQATRLPESDPRKASIQDVKDAYVEARIEAVRAADASTLKSLDDAFNKFMENPTMGGFSDHNDPEFKAQFNAMTDDELRSMSDSRFNAYQSAFTQTYWNEQLVERRRKAIQARPTDTPEMTTDEIQAAVLFALNENGVISTRKIKSLNGEDLQTLDRTMRLVRLAAGPNADFESINKGIARVLVKEHDSQGFWGGVTADDYSQADLLANPHKARQTDVYDRLLKSGYTEDQLDNPVILRQALIEAFADDIRSKRSWQLREGAVK